MRVDLVTREYPPEVYGGAGVHVAELVASLRRRDVQVRVRAFGAPRDEQDTFAYATPAELVAANPAVQTLGTDLTMVHDVAGADLVHSHTWYANAAGRVASLLHGIPHVVTAHSLEPLRPWKAEQLGGGYALSSAIERTAFASAAAVIAVSSGMRTDVLRSYPSVRSGAGARDLQRHRRRRAGIRSRIPRCWPSSESIRKGPRSCSSVASPARRD